MVHNRATFEKLLKNYPDLFHTDEIEDALNLYDLALGGNVHAMLEISNIYRHIEQFSSSIHWLNEAANLGDLQAMYELGNCYFEGLGVEENVQKAFEYYKKAAEEGHAHAANNLADMYLNGEGVSVNEKKLYTGLNLQHQIM